LVEGEQYYLEVLKADYGSDQLSVAVEIEQDGVDVSEHHHAIKEVQKINIDVLQEFDTMRFTIENMDDGTFKAIFTDPSNGNLWTG
jgi:hypothetical protein